MFAPVGWKGDAGGAEDLADLTLDMGSRGDALSVLLDRGLLQAVEIADRALACPLSLSTRYRYRCPRATFSHTNIRMSCIEPKRISGHSRPNSQNVFTALFETR